MAQKVKRSAREAMDLQEFGRRLVDLMARKGLSQSDLARAIWGSVPDTRGHDTARNRDRISQYARGLQMPEPKTLAKIADELGVTPADLNPALDRPGDRKLEEPMLTMVGGRPDLALLTISRVMPMKDALDILAIIMRQGAVDTLSG